MVMQIRNSFGEAISDAAMWLARETDAGKTDAVFSKDVFVVTGGPFAWIAALAACLPTSFTDLEKVRNDARFRQERATATAAVQEALDGYVAKAEQLGLETFRGCDASSDERMSRHFAEAKAQSGILKMFCGPTVSVSEEDGKRIETESVRARGFMRTFGPACHPLMSEEKVLCCAVAAARKKDVVCE
jgi:hypothetical protein